VDCADRLELDEEILRMEEQLSDQEQQRRLKLERLRTAGVDAYPARAHRTHTASEAVQSIQTQGEGDQPAIVTVVGRLTSSRVMGKSSFAHIEDETGRIQLYLRQDVLGEEAYELYRRDLDLGDFVEATGPLFHTRTGEATLSVSRLRLLAKALRPLPVVKEKDGRTFDAFADKEQRYRQRYVDLAVNPHVREVFRARARIVSALRRFLDDRGFVEVETPVLQPIYGGAAARPFTTHHNQLDQDLYLRISDELYLKRLIVGGFERVYEIGRDFRNEGVSFKHNPEFTQLEFYLAYADYEQVMAMAEEMVAYAASEAMGTTRITREGHEIDLAPPWRRWRLRDAIREVTGIDYEACTDADSLYEAMLERGYAPERKVQWGKLIDPTLINYVESHLMQPTFLYDYPLQVSPLAKRKPGQPSVVERFEFFIGGVEMGNAFSEINDPLDQRERFLATSQALSDGDEEAHPLDEDYVAALGYGMPPTGGFGMGIDRLTMLLTGQDTLREVILFPHLRTRE
jgi:lysyl-tRNA synthetase class 2